MQLAGQYLLGVNTAVQRSMQGLHHEAGVSPAGGPEAQSPSLGNLLCFSSDCRASLNDACSTTVVV